MMLSPSASVTAAPSSHARRRFFLPAFICSAPFFDGAKGGGFASRGWKHEHEGRHGAAAAAAAE